MRTYRTSLSDLGALRLPPGHQRGRHAAGGRPAVVHGAVRPRQPDHQLPGASVPARAGGDHAAGARRGPGARPRGLPRTRARQDPARVALRRADRPGRAPALAVLRVGRCDAALPDPLGRVPPLVRRRRAGAGARAERPSSARVDRGQRRCRRGRLCRVLPPQPSTGLVNQCWKDSWDGIQFADGTLPRGPIATCEIQGYVYDARRRAARLAREVWHDQALAATPGPAGERAARRLSPRLLDARARLPRGGARRREASGRQPDLEHRASAVVGPARRRGGGRHGRSAAGSRAVLGLGHTGRSAPARAATTPWATTPGPCGHTTTR